MTYLEIIENKRKEERKFCERLRKWTDKDTDKVVQIIVNAIETAWTLKNHLDLGFLGEFEITFLRDGELELTAYTAEPSANDGIYLEKTISGEDIAGNVLIENQCYEFINEYLERVKPYFLVNYVC